MIFIVGGAHQGKMEYARSHFQADSKEAYEIVNAYHEVVLNQMNQNQDPLQEAERLVETHREKQTLDSLIIISNELGYGLVPMDKNMRIYREQNGRVNCFLAAKADTVIRVVAGIGTVIKQA